MVQVTEGRCRVKTIYTDGTPFGLADLISTFALRIDTLSNFAGMIEMKNGLSAEARTLAVAIAHLRDDWTCFLEAVQQWDERENGTQYLHTTTKGAKP